MSAKARTKMSVVVVGMALLLSGCGDDTTQREGTAPQTVASVGGETTADVVVTSDDEGLPDGCSPREVAQITARFVDAFNRGDGAALSRTFFISEGPSPPDFSEGGYYPWSWYSMSQVGAGGKIVGGFITYDEADLLRYFARRHEAGERLRLLKVSPTRTGLLDEADNVGIVLVLTREADDLPPGLGGPDGVATGKGAINCKNGQIFTLSMEMSMQEQRNFREAAAWLCDAPADWNPEKEVVACA